MIKADFTRRGGLIAEFTLTGHAGYAESGLDIVCAAVSMLAQTTVIGLTEVANLPLREKRDDERGHLSVKLPDEALEPARILLETLLKGLEAIDHNYPGFLRITCKEGRQYHV